jgi:DNA-binding MarR family transcriptional regulator
MRGETPELAAAGHDPVGSDAALLTRARDLDRRTLASFTAARREQLIDLDLPLPQFKVLLLLGKRARQTCGQLARRLGITPSNITAINDRLCDAGLIVRDTDPDDRRTIRVRLTPAGQQVLDRFEAAGDNVRAGLLGRLAPDDLALVVRALERLDEAAGRES